MATQAEDNVVSSKWMDGISKAVKNPKWNKHDCEIQSAVNDYNRHLSDTTGYKHLDWRLIKAILWVESGAEDAAWRTNPMQIGVTGDPGLDAFLHGNEGGEIILPSAWHGRIHKSSAITIPAHNIRAGIGYLLMRAAHFEHRSVEDDDREIYEVGVSSGDSLAKIARNHQTTIEILKKLNPGSAVLQPGKILKYRKGRVQRVIVGWDQIDVARAARLYNGNGDNKYVKKLKYAFDLVKRGEVAICE